MAAMKNNGIKKKLLTLPAPHHIMAAGFLSALKESLDENTAIKIAEKGFANYMIFHYQNVLEGKGESPKERFICLRDYYEMAASGSKYMEIIESSDNCLMAKYLECPFLDVMKKYDVSEFSEAFCKSDYRFTEKLFPGVKFSREHELSKGDAFCDHCWKFNQEEAL